MLVSCSLNLYTWNNVYLYTIDCNFGRIYSGVEITGSLSLVSDATSKKE